MARQRLIQGYNPRGTTWNPTGAPPNSFKGAIHYQDYGLRIIEGVFKTLREAVEALQEPTGPTGTRPWELRTPPEKLQSYTPKRPDDYRSSANSFKGAIHHQDYGLIVLV